ncbi:MAG: hypothetical protein Ct9H300mP15_27600 [Gemmatimonadota bacterium]|nr:MAG: hypothetical protein Ct9H300mP15_27600 [Gemmatimonadota bacterium]
MSGDAAHVPRIDVPIELVGSVEHIAHVRDATHVPRTDVLIESEGSVEHAAHVRHAAGACGRQRCVILCINKRADLSFRSLGVYNVPHYARLAHIGRRAYDRHAVRCEVERLSDRYSRGSQSVTRSLR